MIGDCDKGQPTPASLNKPCLGSLSQRKGYGPINRPSLPERVVEFSVVTHLVTLVPRSTLANLCISVYSVSGLGTPPCPVFHCSSSFFFFFLLRPSTKTETVVLDIGHFGEPKVWVFYNNKLSPVCLAATVGFLPQRSLATAGPAGVSQLGCIPRCAVGSGGTTAPFLLLTPFVRQGMIAA